MRIKYGEFIREVECVQIRERDVVINCKFYATKGDTKKIGEQLLTQGYADLSAYKRIKY